jgi:hypothetical protein
MSTPKSDLIEETTEPEGANVERPEVIQTSDARAIGDAQSQISRAELIRASAVATAEALVPIAPRPIEQPPKWRGVRSKSLPVRTVQSMTRAARMLYRSVLDWYIADARTVLGAKPRRTPETK